MKHTKRQKDILDTVMKIIQQEGPDGVTIHAIASALSLTDPAIYRHFKSKDDIFVYLFQDMVEATETISLFYTQPGKRGIEILEAIFLQAARIDSENAFLSYTIMNFEMVFKKYPEMNQKIRELRMGDTRNGMAAIERAIAEGDIRSDIAITSIAAIVFGSYQGLFSTWSTQNFAFNLEEAAKGLWPDILKTLKP
jgi:TetR/AcrR family transcriptional regulator, fatty acid metabolism regulator protein